MNKAEKLLIQNTFFGWILFAILFLSLERIAFSEACVNGTSGGIYSCSNVQLLSHLDLDSFPGSPDVGSNLWGFKDPKDGREYAIIGLSNGTAFVDVTNPTRPIKKGFIPALESRWREIKV